MKRNNKQSDLKQKLEKALNDQRAGRFQNARSVYEELLKQSPNSADINNLLGTCYRHLGSPDVAVDHISKAIQLNPHGASYYYQLVRALMDLGGSELSDLVPVLDQGLALNPEMLEAYNLKSTLLASIGRKAEAVSLLEETSKRFPSSAETKYNLGLLYADNDQDSEAEAIFMEVHKSDPRGKDPYLQLARLWKKTNKFHEVERILTQAIALFPNDFDIRVEYSEHLRNVGCFEDALRVSTQLLKEKPDDIARLWDVAYLLYTTNRQDKAIAFYEKLIEHPQAERKHIDWNLGLCHLAKGNAEKGWKLSTIGLKSGAINQRKRKFDVSEWNGEKLENESLLIWHDQGIGDLMRMASMFDDVISRTPKVIIETPQKIRNLFQRSFPKAKCISSKNEEIIGEYKVIHAADLPQILRTDMNSFKKAKRPVFTVDQDLVSTLKNRITNPENKPVVGISWRSMKLNAYRMAFLLNVKEMAPILETPDIIFVNLQYAVLQKEIDWVRDNIGVELLAWDDVDLLNDMDAAFALTSCMDLVISPGTSVSEIAGALGVPCWRFAAVYSSDLLGFDHPPWSPSIRQYSIDTNGPCSSAIPKIKADLDIWVQEFQRS